MSLPVSASSVGQSASIGFIRWGKNSESGGIGILNISFIIPIFPAILFPNSPIKNYEYRRFINNRAPTRRDEGEYLYGSSTEEQRSRRLVFDETLRAEVLLSLCFVAPRSQIPVDMLPRRSALKAKHPFCGGVHSFLTGC
jgi:hypothetical protein